MKLFGITFETKATKEARLAEEARIARIEKAEAEAKAFAERKLAEFTANAEKNFKELNELVGAENALSIVRILKKLSNNEGLFRNELGYFDCSSHREEAKKLCQEELTNFGQLYDIVEPWSKDNKYRLIKVDYFVTELNYDISFQLVFKHGKDIIKCWFEPKYVEVHALHDFDNDIKNWSGVKLWTSDLNYLK